MTKPTYTSFIPPQRLLMGPGPSSVPQRVLDASARPTIGHLDPAFVALMEEIKELLRYAMQTTNALTMPISAPGSAGMESCFVNLLEPGDSVLVCINGVFGQRMRENAQRCGAEVVVVEQEWGKPVNPEAVEQALKDNPQIAVVAFVHAETSTGALSDAQAICAIAQRHGCLSIVDAVTSLAGSPLYVDDWGIDAIYSGTQKCLSGLPGISPVSFSERAVAKISARKHPVQSWFLDQSLVMAYWSGAGKRSYHHTAPVNALYAFHESLLMLHEEGLQSSWQRHHDNHLRLKAGLEKLGLGLLVDEQARLPQLNTVIIPDGIDEAALRERLLQNHNLEIGAGLGALAGKVWRIGLMGESSRPEHVDFCLAALAEELTNSAVQVA